jgi:galactose oxidase
VVRPNISTATTKKTGTAYKPATNHAFVITLGKVNDTVGVKEAAGGMQFQRVFHHAVILPNGDTFIVGGQKLGQGFTDQTPVLTPEIYSPARGAIKDSWTSVAPHSIARTYHSFGLLLQDATILVGGGGLCGNGCEENHFDAQIYTPQYLLTPRGDLAPRPLITKLSPTAAPPGGILTITTKSAVVGASLVRYGSSTHSLNNDQRRIELTLKPTGTAFQYQMSIPSERGIAIPGYWMLFVIDASGVPSEAKSVQIQIAT